jgi:hypothetical protein
MSWHFAERAWRALAIGGVLLLLVACGGDNPTPEDRLRASVDAIEALVEAGDATGVRDYLASDYRDARHPDARSAIASLFLYSRQHRDIHLFTLVRDLQLDEAAGTAQTGILVAMAGVPLESIETLIALKADLYRFDVDWQRVDDEWRIVSSRWQRADLSSLTGSG